MCGICYKSQYLLGFNGSENISVFVFQTHTSSETVQTPCRLYLPGRVVTQYFIQAKLHH